MDWMIVRQKADSLLRNRWVMFYALGVAGIALAFCLNALLDMLAFEARGPMNGDAFIYLTMGRGILNGLSPYLELFESKPPGVFSIMALSLALTGTEAVARWISILLLFSMPVLLALWMWKRGTALRFPMPRLALGTVFGALTGGLLALRLEQIAGSVQTEGFGAGFGFLYVLVILWDRERWRPWKTAAAAVAMMLALFMKEPFVLAFAAIALLVDRHPREYLRHLIIPGLIAGGLLLLVLLVTGWWRGYFEHYLPAMIEQRITGSQPGDFPLLFRALWTDRFYNGLTMYSPIPLLGPVLLGCLFITLLRRGSRHGWLNALLLTAAVLLTARSVAFPGILRLLKNSLQAGGVPPGEYWMVDQYRHWIYWICAELVLTAAVLGGILWRRPRMIMDVAAGVAAIVLLCLAFGIGNYTGNDAAFPFPAYAAVAMIFLEWTFLRDGQSVVSALQKVAGAVTAILIVIAMVTFQPVPQSTRDQFFGERESYLPFSRWLDGLLEACDNPPYYWHGGQPAMAYAKQSPTGPIFTPYFHDYLTLQHPLYLETYDHLRRNVQILLVRPLKYEGEPPIPADILALFGPDAPACASRAGAPPIEDVQVLFRKNP